MKKYPYLIALLHSADDINIKWKFDEQQADPIHAHWYWDKAKEELRDLLQQQDSADSCRFMKCKYENDKGICELMELADMIQNR